MYEKKIEQYCRERDEVLRSLDPIKFEQFWTKWTMPRPPNDWTTPEVPMIMMHKVRLQLTTFTEEEKEVSRKWLTDHGYALD